jgi:hypothetical protein
MINSIIPTVFYIQTIYSSAFFSVSTSVFNNEGTTILQLRGPFTISLSLTPSVTLSGIITSDTNSGSCSFKDLSIASAGTYTLTASSGSLLPGSIQLTIISLSVTSLTVSISPSSVSAFFEFQVTVTLFDQRNQVFTSSSSVNLLLSSNFLGTTSKTTTSGSVIFSLYSISSGTFLIEAWSSSVTGSASITILKPKVVFTSLSSTVFFI